MGEAVSLFVAGLGGVFAGMALLYISIRVTSLITRRIVSGEEKDG
jgi:Na+-transporting methylmalonyl-CoA/oxaloacetate decarboxylase gamma subunit